MAGSERRKHRRVKAKSVAGHLRVKNQVLALGLPIDNISMGGLFLRCGNPLPAGTPVVLELVQPTLGAPLKVVGTSVLAVSADEASRSGRPSGMAIRFDPMPDEVQKRLNRLLVDLVSAQSAKPAPAASHNPAQIGEDVQSSRGAFDFGFVSLESFSDPEPAPAPAEAPTPVEAPAPRSVSAPEPAPSATPASETRSASAPSPVPPRAAPASPPAAAPPKPPPAPTPPPARGFLQPPKKVAVTVTPGGGVKSDVPLQVSEAARLHVQVRGLFTDLGETQAELSRRSREIEALREELARARSELEKKDARIAELELRLARGR